MAVLADPSDAFDRWCDERGITSQDAPAAFARYMKETTGWDGTPDDPVDVPCS